MSRGDRRPPPEIEGLTSLKIDNLSYHTSINELRRIFERYGDIGDVHIPRDKYTKQSRGFGFVRFFERRDAEYALDRTDGKFVDGRELRVSMAKYERPADERGRRRRSRSAARRRSRSPRYSRSPRKSRSRSPRRARSRTRSPPARDTSRSRSRSRSASRSKFRLRSGRTPPPMAGGSPTFVGNVTYPEIQTPAGNLMFDADFESGNLGRVDKISSSEYDLFIRPDTMNNKYRVWFYFECKNALEGQRVIFNIVNFSKQRTLFENGTAAPVVKSKPQNSWSRIPSRHIYYYRSSQHGDRWILSFAFIFEGGDVVKFAYSIPYTYDHLQKWLTELESRNYPFFHRDILTYTVQKRRVDLITIDGSIVENLGSSSKKMVFLTARVHPGESPSSHVLHGFIEFLVSNDDRAHKLRKVYCFKIVPMLNPDGVSLGNYRCSLLGYDLNRMWREPSEWAHSSIFAVKGLLQQYDSNPQAQTILYIDLHAHSQKSNCFLYGNVSTNNEKLCDRQLWLPHLLAELSEDFSLEYTQFNTDAEKAGTGRRTMGELVSCICYTMEVSFFSYRHKDSSGNSHCTPYLQYKYEALGEALAKAILNFYETDCGLRDISLERSFRSFLSSRAQESLKQARQVIKTVQNMSYK
ncbi:unnamed protein product [Caenorhabditis bovis]|uniref:RRM domain-containing protein n=1 Tax=Caenorhabditis bovis TaxID=2654633 RepID=A0A8S1FBK4_9PELO|nr:unnamed protein product [Caenorhabditis bovis]